MTYFLLRDSNILPKKELHSSLWVAIESLKEARPAVDVDLDRLTTPEVVDALSAWSVLGTWM